MFLLSQGTRSRKGEEEDAEEFEEEEKRVDGSEEEEKKDDEPEVEETVEALKKYGLTQSKSDASVWTKSGVIIVHPGSFEAFETTEEAENYKGKMEECYGFKPTMELSKTHCVGDNFGIWFPIFEEFEDGEKDDDKVD